MIPVLRFFTQHASKAILLTNEGIEAAGEGLWRCGDCEVDITNLAQHLNTY